MNNNTHKFKLASHKITQVSELYNQLDNVKNVTFNAHFDPFKYGKDLCGFTFLPLSDDRRAVSNILCTVGIKHTMVGDQYILIDSDSADIARKLFTDYKHGAVPSVALEQEWLNKIQCIR